LQNNQAHDYSKHRQKTKKPYEYSSFNALRPKPLRGNENLVYIINQTITKRCTHLKLVLAILFGLFASISLGVAGFVLIMPDDDLTAQVRPMPIIGPYADSIIRMKHNTTDSVSYFVEDTFYRLKSTWHGITHFSLIDRTQKVVIQLDPVRIKEQQSTVHEAPPAPPVIPTAKPMQEHVAEPTQLDKQPEPVASPPKKPIPLKTEAAHAPKKAVKNKKTALAHPVKKLIPKPRPIKKPPPVSKTDTGTSEHKTGLTFYKGIGGASKNFKTARKWFLLAADKANAAAQYNLGIMAYLGQGTEQSDEEAAIWFERAAKQDNTLAQYNLGFLYYEGKGVQKDDLEAFMWIDRAARLGDQKALQARKTLEKLLPKNLIEAK
jgi:outer membrane biosynthesis protein TonB